ncbi:uncharacterized protein LOC128502299 [Spea bombifrons]|uniref:uncharacterized protein LOC128502299 n=1 Tax=Spea bombifrons TaxID=233779 RepID=UPI00234B7208|nr:uncharacterized protein LOC128502299 [Spea bombifrons]
MVRAHSKSTGTAWYSPSLVLQNIKRWPFKLYDFCVWVWSFLLSRFSLSLVSTRVVGVFSRDDCFPRLVAELQSQNGIIREVRICQITNGGEQNFRGCVSRCDFAILYHSKTRGRLNIADVTDALYDKELRYLSTQLGKDNVVVVADDLEDSSSEEKERILRTQPSLQEYARDLILISRKEKELQVTTTSRDPVGEKLRHLLTLIVATKLPFYIIKEDKKLNVILGLVRDVVILPVSEQIQRRFPLALVYGRMKPIARDWRMNEERP